MPEYTINGIAEFGSLFDINFGIVRLIRDKFNIKDGLNYKLNQNVINGDNYFLRYMIYTMQVNDLSSILCTDDEDSKDFAKSLCKQIVDSDTYYIEALEKSPPTTIANLIKVYSDTNGIISTIILCRNNTEASFIKKSKINVRTIVGGYNTILNPYDVIYVNEFSGILKYFINSKFEGKEIIIPDYWWNMDTTYPDKPMLEVASILGATNIIKTICPYKNFVLPAAEE